MKVKPLNSEVKSKLKTLGLLDIYNKKVILFENNPRHPSLHYEILKSTKHLMPPTRSFRLNRKYRILGYELSDEFQPTAVTMHYED